MNLRIASLITMASLLLMVFGIGTVYGLNWQIETVDSVGNIYDISLALDSADNPRISYTKASPAPAELKYAVSNGSAWQIQIMDNSGKCGGFNSLKLDNDGRPQISYYDLYSDNLLLFIYSHGTRVVDTTGDVGLHTSLGLDSFGTPKISYYDNSNRDLKYAALVGRPGAIDSYWAIQVVDTAGDVGSPSSLALDSAGNPRIGYFDFTNGDLKYAEYITSPNWTPTWRIQTVDWTGSVGWNPSLALDSADNPHISYYDWTNNQLKYAVRTGSTWGIVTVDPQGGDESSLALDSAGNPHISYYGMMDGNLKYAVYNGTSWQIETVDRIGNSMRHTSLALDDAGYPRISYCEATNADLKYARGYTGAGTGTPPPSDGTPTGETGTLYVASYPSNAIILINGTERGHTDRLVSNLTAGTKNLTLTKAGYLSKTMTVNVPVGDVRILAPITLTKGEGPVPPSGTGSLYVASYPTGATVLIDGINRGMTDQLISNVSAGDRILTLTKGGYNATIMSVNVPANEAKILAPITLPKSGDGTPP